MAISLATIEKLLESNIGVVLLIIAIFITMYIVQRLVVGFLEREFKESHNIQHNPAKYSFLKNVTRMIIFLIGIGIIAYIFPEFRKLSISLFGGAGILALIIGFASKEALSDIIGGAAIIFSNPFKVGDFIRIDKDILGKVTDITLRHTVIRDLKNNRYIIPNSKVANNTIKNFDLEDKIMCKWLTFKISFESNIDKAMKIIRQEVSKHPDFIVHQTKEEKENNAPEVKVKVTDIGEYYTEIRVWVWAKNYFKNFYMNCDLRKSIKERFDKEGINIPYPHKTIVYEKDIRKKRK